MTFKKFDIRCQKSNSSNETPNVMTVGVENYGLSSQAMIKKAKKKAFSKSTEYLIFRTVVYMHMTK
jgi:hypothetical protein